MARRHVGTVALLFCLVGPPAVVSIPLPPPQATERAPGLPPFLDLIPGTTNRAHVELVLGAARGPSADEPGAFEYTAPASVPDASRISVYYFENQIVAELSVYLKTPLPADLLRPRLGALLFSRPSSGGSDEFYFPAFVGLALDKATPVPGVLATRYLCPQGLANRLVRRSNEAVSAGRYADALMDADRAVAVAPDYASGYVQAGRVFWVQKNYDDAAVRFMAATNANYPAIEKGIAHTWLGRIYVEKQLHERARQEFEQGVWLAPTSTFTHYRRGLFLRTQRQEDAALAEFLKVVELDGRHHDALAAAADVLFERGDLGRALPYYKVLSDWAMSADAERFVMEVRAGWHFRYGECLLRGTESIGQWELAAPAYEKAVGTNKKLLPAWDALIDAYLKTGGVDDARNARRRAFAANPGESRFDLRRFGKLVDAGRFVDALLQLPLLETDKYPWLNQLALDCPVPVDLARAYAGLDDRELAIRHLQEAVKCGYRDAATVSADPLFQKYKNDPNFKKLLEEMRSQKGGVINR